MTSDRDELRLSRVSSTSLRDETGRGWDEWLGLLDAAGAATWNHKETVKYLEREHPDVSSWWRQSITVGYEQVAASASWDRPPTPGFR